MSNFCKDCLLAGHQCPAREGEQQCIFCEDGVLCPVSARKSPDRTVRLIGAKPSVKKVEKAQRGKDIIELLRPMALVRSLDEIEVEKGQTMTTETCDRGCGNPRHRGMCKGGKRAKAVSVRKTNGHGNGSGSPHANGKVTLSLSEAQLLAWFAACPLEDKAEMVQLYLARERA